MRNRRCGLAYTPYIRARGRLGIVYDQFFPGLVSFIIWDMGRFPTWLFLQIWGPFLLGCPDNKIQNVFGVYIRVPGFWKLPRKYDQEQAPLPDKIQQISGELIRSLMSSASWMKELKWGPQSREPRNMVGI